jgi:hypothetical protein
MDFIMVDGQWQIRKRTIITCQLANQRFVSLNQFIAPFIKIYEFLINQKSSKNSNQQLRKLVFANTILNYN